MLIITMPLLEYKGEFIGEEKHTMDASEGKLFKRCKTLSIIASWFRGGGGINFLNWMQWKIFNCI